MKKWIVSSEFGFVQFFELQDEYIEFSDDYEDSFVFNFEHEACSAVELLKRIGVLDSKIQEVDLYVKWR